MQDSTNKTRLGKSFSHADELIEKEYQFRLLIDSVKDYAIFALDPNGFIATWNIGAERMKGYSEDEIVGKHFSIFYCAEDLKNDKPNSELVYAKEHGKYEEEGIRLRKDGSLFWAHVVIAPIYDSKHQLIGFSKVTRDISERVSADMLRRESEERLVRLLAEQEIANAELTRSQELLRQRTDELARSNSDLEHFAYVASHDLQEPLRAVSGFVKLLSQEYSDKLDEQALRWIRHTVEGTERMHILIQDLLAYSRLDLDGRTFEICDLSRALKMALQNLEPVIEASGVEIRTSPLPSVNGDMTQLVSLLQNLISNGIKYRGSEIPFVSIAAELVEKNWRISVSDNGIGIDAQYADQIFVIFQRLHTRAKYPGTGIGLALCKRISERHGGRIWMESEVGKGSVFYVELPAIGSELNGAE